MPLRCLQDDQYVHSFTFSVEEWSELKATCRGKNLRMPCCGHGAIPKTSVRGTPFFAHAPNSGCPAVDEPQELLTAKVIIAQAVIAAGWEVITEYRTPEDAADSGGWIADVYAHEGKRNVAFQVQWSPAEMETIRHRQAELRTKGFRGAWFYRLYRKRTYSKAELLDEKASPLFGIRITDDADDFHVPRFGVALDAFVKGMLNGELSWSPVPGKPINAGIYIVKTPCWKCGNEIGVPVGVALRTPEGFLHDFLHFHDDGAAAFISSLLDNPVMNEHMIGPVTPRFSKTANKTYLSNGCYFCGAMQGEFYVRQMALGLGFDNAMPLPTFQVTIALPA